MTASKRWIQSHRARYNELQRANNQKRQYRTQWSAGNHRTLWTFAHYLAALTLPHAKAAYVTGRTYAAIANRVRKFKGDDIIAVGACDGCGNKNTPVQIVNGAPVAGAALCRGCLETS